MVLHPGAKLEGSCLREYKFLRMMVFLTIATSLAALIYRPLGVRKPFSGKLTCCVVWLDTLLTLAIFCASVCGIAMTFSEPEEEHFVCTELYTLSSWFYLAFGVISFIMLVPAFFVVCCFGSAAHARETAAGAGDDEAIGYRKLNTNFYSHFTGDELESFYPPREFVTTHNVALAAARLYDEVVGRPGRWSVSGKDYKPSEELVKIFEAKTEQDKGATTNQLAEWAAFLKKYDGLEGRWESKMRPMDPEESYISAEKQFQNQKQYEQQIAAKRCQDDLSSNCTQSSPWSSLVLALGLS